jgi:hypothetical protein
VTIPKDSETATVQWPLTNVGGNFPGADPACQTDPFRGSDNSEFMATVQVPAQTFLAEGPHTLTLDKARTGRVPGGQINSDLAYSLTFVRVNEDGSPR